MRFSCFFVIICFTLLLAQTGLARGGRPNLKNLDKPIELNAGEIKRMYVTFNHSSHKDVKCRTCHHTGLSGNRYASCTSPECHALTAPSSREVLSVYMAYHAPDMDRSCFGCHKPLVGKYPNFKGCQPCHQSLSAWKTAESLKTPVIGGQKTR